MTILEQINYDLYEAMKSQDQPKRDGLRLILGEVQRSPKKLEHDVDIIKILKSLKKNTEQTISLTMDNDIIWNLTEFVSMIETYLPEQVPEKEVEDWMRANINFDSLKNIKQAIGIAKKHFGETVDGKTVNEVLNKITK